MPTHAGLRILHLYRPRLPSYRAQAIQVLHTAHALAKRGHHVTLLADPGMNRPTVEAVLDAFQLCPLSTLDLRFAPWKHPGLSGLWFRRQVARWWEGPPGLVLARDKRRLLAALRRHSRHPDKGNEQKKHRVILETHELDSALALESHTDPGPFKKLEADVARRAYALVANCHGTLAMWEQAAEEWSLPLPARTMVCHNATSPTRVRPLVTDGDQVIRYIGSLGEYKGTDILFSAAPLLPLPLELVGTDRRGHVDVGAVTSNVLLQPPLPYPLVPDLLARSRCLLLPLRNNLYGRSLTSPLKIWDYLATCVPIVAADLPSIREIMHSTRSSIHLYRPGDHLDMVRAVATALASGQRPSSLRSWAQRARELEDLF